MIKLVVFTATNIRHGLREGKRISSPFDFDGTVQGWTFQIEYRL